MSDTFNPKAVLKQRQRRLQRTSRASLSHFSLKHTPDHTTLYFDVLWEHYSASGHSCLGS
jgi:hypothetical protein